MYLIVLVEDLRSKANDIGRQADRQTDMHIVSLQFEKFDAFSTICCMMMCIVQVHANTMFVVQLIPFEYDIMSIE